MIRVMFAIPDLRAGGAERQIVELLRGLDKNCFDVTLATFHDGGAFESEVQRIPGLALLPLRRRGRWDIVGFLWRFRRAAQEARTHILHGYMGLASNVCLLVGRAAGAKVVWSLRAAEVDYDRYDWRFRCTFRAGALLSRYADLIIVNSEAGRQYHISQGYCGKRIVVIPNGIDTERYRPDDVARRRMRAEWGLRDHVLIGLAARLDIMKDHPTFLRAAAELIPANREVRFVCIGGGSEEYRRQLEALSASLGIADRLIWTGEVKDMAAAYNALDLLASTSYGEGFPNAIGEAMACGIPCVVTDVGDSAHIVGDTGTVVPPKDPTALARAWQHWLSVGEDHRRVQGARARERIESNFNLQRMLARTEMALRAVTSPNGN